MKTCWAKECEKRPFFSDIVTTIANYTEVIAGYLDVNFNPFKSAHDVSNYQEIGADIMDSTDNEKDVLISAGLLAKQLETNKNKSKKSSKISLKMSPKSSRKQSPHVSPCPSPHGSPIGSPRPSPQVSPCPSHHGSPKGSPKPSPRVSPCPSLHGSQKGSTKPSPRVSPCPSPSGSPLLKAKKMSSDQRCTDSNAAVEIHIQSPSDDGSVENVFLH